MERKRNIQKKKANGLIETYKGCYVKNYLIGDNNYLTAPEEEQNVYYRGWKKVLNSFGSNVEFAITFNNRSINMTDFFESVLIKETGDEFDHLRKQMNTIIVDRMQDGKNGIQKDKYLTVAVHSDEHLITRSRVIDEDGRTREVKSFDYRNMRSMGLEINDLIAPTSFDIVPEYIQMGNKFSRTLRVTNLPSQLNDEFINSAVPKARFEGKTLKIKR